MFLVREVLNCRPGKVGEMISKFNVLSGVMKRLGYKPFRLCTDVSGERFWTLVAETEIETIDGMLEMERRVMAEKEAGEAMAGYHELIAKGRREIYRIEG
ncbi:MAG: hypothetical protein OEV30_05000 [Ignavibacteria bacterium]|nr:hypothetical protein [Ignavibacteria bacterium]